MIGHFTARLAFLPQPFDGDIVGQDQLTISLQLIIDKHSHQLHSIGKDLLSAHQHTILEITINSKNTFAIGLAKKAGRLVSGAPIVIDAMRSGKVTLAVYAARASQNSVKRVTDKAKTYETIALPLDVTPEELGHSVGKVGAVSAVGITDKGFADAIKKILSE